MRYRFILLANLFLYTALFAETITLGIVPQQSPHNLINDWKPVANYLESASGVHIILKTERSIPEFEKVLYRGGYDIAYMNPYHYVLAHDKKGYSAIIRDEKNIVGILVVRKESGITDVSMTKGKEFLFPAPDAFAATLLTKYELKKKFGIDVKGSTKFRYVNSHDSVYKGVSRRVGDVGGGIERTLNSLDDQETRGALAILHRTQAYPSHPFAVKPSVSGDTQKKLIKALLEMPEELLASLSMKRMIETQDSEYDRVRDLDGTCFHRNRK